MHPVDRRARGGFMESNSAWKSVYRVHLMLLERFLLQKKSSLESEHTVYLSGMLARHLDREYQQQIEDLLFEDVDELDSTIRKHDPYLGQNAPIVTLSRINGEHLTVAIAFERLKGHSETLNLQSAIPSRCFGVAAFYSREAGNRQLSRIFGYFHHHHKLILDLLTDYLSFLDRDADLLPDNIPEELWQKFGREKNLRNEKKEWWEARGIDLKSKEGISKEEVMRILDLGGMN
ncbi:MAG TPA: hypothetical protein DEA96_01815 [Leptospiraceae bacterium]|nr:hypothetical protein [Spirochaetaceae bacterium]HBS03670.1 hypothetical protein [Leptospiraceae bacterium]